MQLIDILAGRPEHGGDKLADLIWTVDERLMTFLLKSPENWRRLHPVEWNYQQGTFCYSCSHVATLDGQVAGVMIALDPLQLDMRMRRTVAHWQEFENSPLVDHLTYALGFLDRLFPHLPDDAYFVFDLAVDRQLHGKGIGRRFIEIAEAEGVALGRKTLVLDVNGDNPAVDFYRHLGFEIAIETSVPELDRGHGVGVHYRMMKQLH